MLNASNTSNIKCLPRRFLRGMKHLSSQAVSASQNFGATLLMLVVTFSLPGCGPSSMPYSVDSSLALFRANGVVISQELEVYSQNKALEILSIDDFREETDHLQKRIEELTPLCENVKTSSVPSRLTNADLKVKDKERQTHDLSTALQVVAHARDWDVEVKRVRFMPDSICETQFSVRLSDSM